MINEIKNYLTEFNSSYFIKYLKEDKTELIAQLNMETCLEKDLCFDWEAYDYFIGELSVRYKIDISKFYLNAHTEAMSHELKRIPTKLAIHFVGLKKWMALDEIERVHLKIKHIVKAIERGNLDSKKVFEEIDKSKAQKKIYCYFK